MYINIRKCTRTYYIYVYTLETDTDPYVYSYSELLCIEGRPTWGCWSRARRVFRHCCRLCGPERTTEGG